jgi:hypothetical protein
MNTLNMIVNINLVMNMIMMIILQSFFYQKIQKLLQILENFHK